MTRILVQRGSAGGSSSSNPSRSSSSSARAEPQVSTSSLVISSVKDEEIGEQVQEQVVVDELLDCGSTDNKVVKGDEHLMESIDNDRIESSSEVVGDSDKLDKEENVGSEESIRGLGGLRISEGVVAEGEDSSGDSQQISNGSPHPPPPPVPPPKPLAANSNSRRLVSGSPNPGRTGLSRRAAAWPVVSTRTSPSGSRPSSPRSHGESEGYNSADEQSPCFASSYDDLVSFRWLLVKRVPMYIL